MSEKQSTIIESIGIYLPPRSVSTSDVLKGCANLINFPLEKITGIRTRRMAGQHEFSIDLARNAIIDCLAKSKYSATDIDLLVCCNISRYDGENRVSFEPGTSVRLRKDFGFHNALVFDITNACAGMFTGIYIVNALIKTGTIRRAMVVSGEYITHLTRTAQKEIESFMDARLACLTLGDGGAAIILEKAFENNTGFQELDLQTFGRYSPYCVAKASDRGGMIMYTDSVNLTDVAVRSGAKHAMNALHQTGWEAESFHHLIMHQTSGMTLNSARQEINRLLKSDVCNDDNTINNLDQRGNTASTSHFIALVDHIRNKKINPGDKIIFSISASGLTTGTALYIFDDLPDRLRHPELLQPKKTSSGEPSDPPAKRFNQRKIRIESVGTIPEEKMGKKNSLNLLNHAANNCFSKSSYNCNDIGLLIYSGVYRSEYVLEPAYAALLAGELDMNATATSNSDGKKTLAFDIFNGSIGFLNGCYVAQQMIDAGNCETAMIVAAEIENNFDWSNSDLVGVKETASGVILDASPANSSGFSNFLFKYNEESIDAYTTYTDISDTQPYLHVVKDAGLESLYIDCMLSATKEILELEGLVLDDINIFFPPQVSSAFIMKLSEALGLPPAKFIDVAGKGPDLFSSSLPYAFDHVYSKGLVKSGDIGLIISAGSGIQVGCAIYHF